MHEMLFMYVMFVLATFHYITKARFIPIVQAAWRDKNSHLQEDHTVCNLHTRQRITETNRISESSTMG